MPYGAGDASLLASTMPSPTIGDLTEANAALRRLMQNDTPIWIRAIPLEKLRQVTFVDASLGNAKGGSAQIGHLACMTDDTLFAGARAPVSVLTYKSHRNPRSAASTLLNEATGMSEGLADSEWIASWFGLAKSLDYDLRKRHLLNREVKIQCLATLHDDSQFDLNTITDAKSLYDNLMQEQYTGAEKRAALEICVIRDSLESLGGRARWIPHDRNPADCLTKLRGNAEAMLKLLRDGSYQLVAEEDEMAARAAYRDATGKQNPRPNVSTTVRSRSGPPSVSPAASAALFVHIIPDDDFALSSACYSSSTCAFCVPPRPTSSSPSEGRLGQPSEEMPPQKANSAAGDLESPREYPPVWTAHLSSAEAKEVAETMEVVLESDVSASDPATSASSRPDPLPARTRALSASAVFGPHPKKACLPSIQLADTSVKAPLEPAASSAVGPGASDARMYLTEVIIPPPALPSVAELLASDDSSVAKVPAASSAAGPVTDEDSDVPSSQPSAKMSHGELLQRSPQKGTGTLGRVVTIKRPEKCSAAAVKKRQEDATARLGQLKEVLHQRQRQAEQREHGEKDPYLRVYKDKELNLDIRVVEERYLNPQTLLFSAAQINNKFNDGRTIEHLIEGYKKPQKPIVPKIRAVIQSNGSFMAMDNRRLAAMKVASRRGYLHRVPIEIIEGPLPNNIVSTTNGGQTVKVKVRDVTLGAPGTCFLGHEVKMDGTSTSSQKGLSIWTESRSKARSPTPELDPFWGKGRKRSPEPAASSAAGPEASSSSRARPVTSTELTASAVDPEVMSRASALEISPTQPMTPGANDAPPDTSFRQLPGKPPSSDALTDTPLSKQPWVIDLLERHPGWALYYSRGEGLYYWSNIRHQEVLWMRSKDDLTAFRHVDVQN